MHSRRCRETQTEGREGDITPRPPPAARADGCKPPAQLGLQGSEAGCAPSSWLSQTAVQINRLEDPVPSPHQAHQLSHSSVHWHCVPEPQRGERGRGGVPQCGPRLVPTSFRGSRWGLGWGWGEQCGSILLPRPSPPLPQGRPSCLAGPGLLG